MKEAGSKICLDMLVHPLMFHQGEQITSTPNSYLKRGPFQNSRQIMHLLQVRSYFMVWIFFVIH